MDVDNGLYTYTDKNGEKHRVPIERVSSLTLLQKGDHIALPRFYSNYWHHAIVEDIDTGKDEINVIEYSNAARGFSEDIASYPKNPGMAEVQRGKYKLENEDVYVIKYQECLDEETSVARARSRLGEREYRPFANNCEHFVVWCKTGVSASEQGDKAKKVVKGIGNVAGFAAGAAIGQVLIRRRVLGPIGRTGRIVGNAVSGLARRYVGVTEEMGP